MVSSMGKNSNWFVAVKKAFRPESEKKKSVKTGKSKWMCRGKRHLQPDSSFTEEEPDGVDTREPDVAVSVSESMQVSFAGSVVSPATEANLSEPTQQVKAVETVSASIKEESTPEISLEHIKEAVTEIVTVPTEDVRLAETVSPSTQESKLAETIVAPLEEERKPTETGLEPTRRANFAEIVSAPALLIEEARLAEKGDDQNRRSYSVALATAAASQADVAAAQAVTEFVRLATVAIPCGRSREELAAIKIQSMFRGHLARRALQALRGLERLKSLIDGNDVKRQSTSTLRCMQMFARVQSQVHWRRIRMSEENQSLQHQLLLKHQKELEILKNSPEEDWDNSTQSKERIKDNLIHKQEGVIRRERALAYAFSHQQQWRHPTKSTNPLHSHMNDPQWGWSWLERWMAVRPWENRCATDHSDAASAGSSAQRGTDDQKTSPDFLKPARTSMRLSPSRPSSATGRRPSVSGRPKLHHAHSNQDDLRSTLSSRSRRRNRRQSLSPSCTRDDDEKIMSAPFMHNYMQSTQSTRAKSRFRSPTGEKRLPFTSAAATSGHGRILSGPGTAETSSVGERADSEPTVSSGSRR